MMPLKTASNIYRSIRAQAALHGVLAFVAAAALATGCMNNDPAPVMNLAGSNGASPSPTPSGPNVITNVTNTGDGTSLSTTIYFDASIALDLTNYCTAKDTGARSCFCQFTWSEGNNGVTVSRNLTSAVSVSQRSLISCPTPQQYETEIPDGTSVQITVIPGTGNLTGLSIPAYQVSKAAAPQSGDFQDNGGHFFKNVSRYGCYDMTIKGLEVRNFIARTDSSDVSQQVYVPFANTFCFRRSSDGAPNDPSGCSYVDPIAYSAQSYYYNFYTKTSDVGNLNSGNKRFGCPRVFEGLNGNSQRYWPLDSSFALASVPSAQYDIGVESFIRPSQAEDQLLTKGKACDPKEDDTTEGGNTSSVLRGCLGFAARPATDGSCPNYTDKNGNVQKLYRLRRYVAIYPPRYEASGQAINQPLSSDTVYVIDRPGPSGRTMHGPKPCGFSYLDIANTSQAYRGTNDTAWSGRSIDGTMFPSTTIKATKSSDDQTQLSCPALIPSWSRVSGSPDLNALAYNTSVAMPVRGVTPWAPHYEEDTDFEACAPLSSEYVDPPIHMVQTSDGDTRWCTESYPTRNGTSGYGSFATTHSGNRVVSDTSLHPDYYPLLAPAKDVEAMLKSDSSYGCFEGWSASSKAGSCCSNVTLAKPTSGNISKTHLEPGKCSSF